MFTGIVTDVGEIDAPDADGAGPVAPDADRPAVTTARPSPTAPRSPATASVSPSSPRASKAARPGSMSMPLARETLGMTTAKQWGVGTRLNLERALKIGERARRPYRSRPRRRHRYHCRARRSARHGTLRVANHPRTGAFHRGQGLGDAGWRVIDREYGGRYRLFGADHPAYAQM